MPSSILFFAEGSLQAIRLLIHPLVRRHVYPTFPAQAAPDLALYPGSHLGNGAHFLGASPAMPDKLSGITITWGQQVLLAGACAIDFLKVLTNLN